ncbi:hypothetical protein [Paracoccus versutus]|uniref:hypothetical protein n=1 Tax=Paracoccus versutus TaxID=34007 RepID=UPI00051DA1CD|nr:hypothetical protein [Paracoccus versutus]KGJ01968.1 hypothetical protein IT40_26560 [Paracoccus versutus]
MHLADLVAAGVVDGGALQVLGGQHHLAFDIAVGRGDGGQGLVGGGRGFLAHRDGLAFGLLGLGGGHAQRGGKGGGDEQLFHLIPPLDAVFAQGG